jgi:DNA-binding Lrp family transcriptional regulator
VTGRANLMASVVCRDIEELYGFVTTRIGAIEGVQQVEVLPVYRRIKQAGALFSGDRLAAPLPLGRSARPGRWNHQPAD